MTSSNFATSTPTGGDTYSSAMADAHNYMSWILNAFAPYLHSPILEIGVGHGSYSKQLCAFGNYSGIDIDSRSVAEARQRFPLLKFSVSDICSPKIVEDFSEKFQSIVCLNVLEHIQRDELAVSNLARLLSPGGRLLIIVPAHQRLYNDLDALAGHYRRYSHNEIRELLQRCDLKPELVSYFNPVGGLGWWANRLKRHKSLNDSAVNGQIRIFDRWLVPLSRRLDPLTRKFFGQSVIAVGQKQ